MSFPRYERYKDSGVEWLGEVPEHWDVIPLKRLADFINGDAFKPTEWAESGTPIIRIQNLNGGEEFNYYEGEVEPRYLVHDGDLLFGWSGNRGTSFGPFLWRRKEVCALNQHIFRVVPKTLPKQSLYWTLKAVTAHVEDQAHGIIGMVHITKGDLGSINVPIPPEEEHRQLSMFLNRETAKIDALIEEQRRLIELLKEKRQAVISHAVTKGLNPDAPMKDSGTFWIGNVPKHWGVSSLRYFAHFSSGSTPDRTKESYWGGDIPWVKTGEIDYALISNTEEMITVEGMAESSVTLAPAGSMLLALYGQGVTRGRVAMLGVDATFNQACVAIQSDKRIDRAYLFAFFVFAYRFIREIGNETTQMNLNLDFVKAIRVPLPSLPEQRNIAESVASHMSSSDSLVAEAMKTIELLQERRSALISAAVTGKIDVRASVAKSVMSATQYSSGFAHQLLAAEILDRCNSQRMGRIKLQKLIHLCEYHGQVSEVQGDYSRKAAGPFDARAMAGISKNLKKQKWFEEVKDGERYVYRPLEKSGEHKKYLAHWQAQMPRIDEVLSLLGTFKTRECEIVSTLYAAWNDLLIDGGTADDVSILHEASSAERWHKSKEQIAPERWKKALQWMKDKGLVPVGYGKHTRHNPDAIDATAEVANEPA
jgi:type I restriction enzyme S subunit